MGPPRRRPRWRSTLNGLFRYLVLLFSLPVLLFLGLPLFDHAWNGLRRGVLSTDWLLASGVAAAFAFSFLSVFRGRGPIYFEVGCVILVLTTLGRWLEATGKRKASAALDALTRLLPDQVRRISDGQEQLVPRARDQGRRSIAGAARRAVSRRRPGRLSCRPGRRACTDGREPAGAQGDRRSNPGGHAQPRWRFDHPGDRGRRQGDAGAAWSRWFASRANRRGDTSGWPTGSRADSYRLSRPLRSWPSAAHWALGSLERGLWAGLAVSLIACPCALGLAAPLAVWSALGNAAGQRVLFRSGEALERLADIVAVRFDKTGTLTTGAATVSQFVLEHADQLETTLAPAAALAAVSPHAMSHAIVEFARRPAGRTQ